MVRHRTIEEYIEVLERLEIPIEATASKGRFEEWIKGHMSNVVRETIEEFWKSTIFKYTELAPKGIKTVVVRYPWGSQIRFGLRGRRGLFGVERITRMFKLPW